MSERQWLAGVCLAAVLGTLVIASCGRGRNASSTTGLVKVREAGLRVLYMWPLMIANNKGFFRDEGLDFEYVEVDSGLLGVAALVSGNVQFADIGANDAAILHAQGKDLMLVYQLVNRMTMNVVFSRAATKRLGVRREMPLAERLRALKGLRIGITRPGAPSDIFIRYFLQQAGLDPDRDATLLPVGGATPLASALRTGQIDAYLLSPPIPDDIGTVIIDCAGGDVPELNDVPFVNLAVARAYATEHPQVLYAYVRAVRRAIAWAGSHRDEALRIVAGYFPDVHAPALARAWDDLARSVSPTGVFTEQGVRSYLSIMVRAGVFPTLPPTAEGTLWTNRFTTDQLADTGTN